MLLIAREELIIGVIEGVFIAVAIMYVIGIMYLMAMEACRHFLGWCQRRRKRQVWNRILEGKVMGPGPAE